MEKLHLLPCSRRQAKCARNPPGQGKSPPRPGRRLGQGHNQPENRNEEVRNGSLPCRITLNHGQVGRPSGDLNLGLIMLSGAQN